MVVDGERDVRCVVDRIQAGGGFRSVALFKYKNLDTYIISPSCESVAGI